MRRYFQKIGALLLVNILVFAHQAAMACPGCKEVPGQGGSGATDGGANVVSALGAGFSWSVLFMLAMPMLLLSGLTVLIVQQCKRLQQPAAITDAHGPPAE